MGGGYESDECGFGFEVRISGGGARVYLSGIDKPEFYSGVCDEFDRAALGGVGGGDERDGCDCADESERVLSGARACAVMASADRREWISFWSGFQVS